MDNLKINSGPTTFLKEQQISRDHRPNNHRTTSWDGDSTKARSVRHDHPTKPRQSDQTETISSLDMRKFIEEYPSLVVTGQEDETPGEEPLPPPEVTSASVMAMIRLEGSMSNLKEAIGIYEEFDQICRGKHRLVALYPGPWKLTFVMTLPPGHTSSVNRWPISGMASMQYVTQLVTSLTCARVAKGLSSGPSWRALQRMPS